MCLQEIKDEIIDAGKESVLENICMNCLKKKKF